MACANYFTQFTRAQVCPLCLIHPCQCFRRRNAKTDKPKETKKKIKKANKKEQNFKPSLTNPKKKGIRTKQKGVEKYLLRQTDADYEKLQSHLMLNTFANDCECGEDKFYGQNKDGEQLVIGELINFFWVLLSPDCLNQLRSILSKDYGLSPEKAKEFIDSKQENVLKNLRNMALNQQITPFTGNVITYLTKKKRRCPDSDTWLQKCYSGLLQNIGVDEQQEPDDQKSFNVEGGLRPIDIEQIFEKIFRDIKAESKRKWYCEERYKENNRQPANMNMFSPWSPSACDDLEKTSDGSKSTVHDSECCKLCMWSCQCLRCAQLRDKLFNGLMQTRVSPGTESPYEEISKVLQEMLRRTFQQVDGETFESAGENNVKLTYPNRSVHRSTLNPDYSLLTSCHAPKLTIIKDCSTEVPPDILAENAVQTDPTQSKRIGVQFNVTSKDGNTQTKLSDSVDSLFSKSVIFQIDEAIANGAAVSIENNDTISDNRTRYEIDTTLELSSSTKQYDTYLLLNELGSNEFSFDSVSKSISGKSDRIQFSYNISKENSSSYV